MDRRRFLAAALALAAAGPAAAEPAFRRLIPLFVDLPGFEGRKPDGVTTQTGEGTLTTASRFYVKAPATFEVTVVSGAGVESPTGAFTQDLNATSAAGHVSTEEIDGFRLMKTYSVNEKSGALLIGLARSTTMTVDYRELTEDEAVALARKFDWKAIAAAAK